MHTKHRTLSPYKSKMLFSSLNLDQIDLFYVGGWETRVYHQDASVIFQFRNWSNFTPIDLEVGNADSKSNSNCVECFAVGIIPLYLTPDLWVASNSCLGCIYLYP